MDTSWISDAVGRAVGPGHQRGHETRAVVGAPARPSLGATVGGGRGSHDVAEPGRGMGPKC